MTMLPFQHDIDACLEILDTGGLILYPTDTIWGIGCDATNEMAVEKIYRLKQRPDHKPMVVLMADEREILQYVTQPDLQVFDYIKGVSKPITVVYEGGVRLADQLLADDRSVAIRITSDSFCKHLIKRFKKPIVSTSANLSGYPAPRSFQDIDPLIKEGVDYVVRYRQSDDNYYKPSSVVRWDKNGELIIIRS
ncbi:MAG: L-threonylcarbamoyladenylate synthase [Sediminibacterium sp.]|uniref:L-threonylcarbamoyladenylate synthase n=1 Tax=Sediminibacterium sp. TaxID=1917865 RepID=UPI002ABB71D8|nr:L-threonylcarbamoyladenylate synthase [Sediminibacterium sp.]MDZ4072316.1 L-threonylcarbamoyladenylate synthase [Sediminibacterium sp.]